MSFEIRFDIWRASGKWAYGGTVEISGKYRIWDEELKDEIVANQTEVVDGAFLDATVTIRDLDKYDPDPTYTHFYTHMFRPGAFNAAVARVKAATAGKEVV